MRKMIFCLQISMKVCYKLIIWLWWRWWSIPEVPKKASLQCLYNISKNKLEMMLIFCMQINTKVSYKLISKFIWGIEVSHKTWYYHYSCMHMIKHSQSNKFAISLQYLKEVRNGVHFLHTEKHQNSTSWHYHFRI